MRGAARRSRPRIAGAAARLFALALPVVLALPALPAVAADRLAVLPLRNVGPAAAHLSWIEEDVPVFLGQLIAAQSRLEILPRESTAALAAAWGALDGPPSAEALQLAKDGGARAALAGTFQSQAGSLRVQADLYADLAATTAPVRISLNGKVGQTAALASALAEIVCEALTGQFPRVLRLPLPAPPELLLARIEPSFGPRNPGDNLAQSETFLQTALKIDPNNAEAYAQMGTLYARHGLADKALANFSTAVELSPKTPRHHWNLGLAHYQRGQLEEALTEFLQSTVIDENFVDGFVALGALHARLGDADASRAALQKAVKVGPTHAEALVALGVSAYLAKDVSAAQELFEKAYAINPRQAAASVNLGVLAWEQGNADVARRNFERALAAVPSHPEALNNLGILDAEKGALEAAAQRFAGALEAGAARAPALCNLGTFQMLSGDFGEADRTFQRVLDLAPDHGRAQVNLGFIRLLRGRLADAQAALTAVREDSPIAALASYDLALTHHLVRNLQQALVHYLRALQARRDLVPAHINLGILFEVMGRPEKALTEYLKALSAEEEASPEVYTYLGQVYAQRGYGSMAEETMRKTTLIDSNRASAWHALAIGLEPLDAPKAIAAWRQFLEAVRRDRNRAFWIPIAERRLAVLGAQ